MESLGCRTVNRIRVTSIAREAREKKAPGAAIFDAQSVKVANHPGVRGYDAGEKIRGRAERSETDSRRLPAGARRQPRS